jgi:hypothetical protein
MSNVHVDLPSLHEHFPTGIPVPPLLQAFGEWLKTVPHGGLGFFDALAGERFEYYVSDDDATDVQRPQLAQFLFLGEGSRVALWNHGGLVPAVVLIGSEGDLENLAPSLEAFLFAWTIGETGVGDLDFADDLDEEHADAPVPMASRPDLAAWLKERGVVAPDVPEPPSFQDWFESVVKASAQARAARAAVRPALRIPSAPPVDLLARVESLLGKRTDDAELLGLCTELGFDLTLLPGPDEFRALARLDQGYCLELVWPWQADKSVTFSKQERDAIERQRLRVLTAIELHAQGDRATQRALDNARFSAFPHALPRGISFQDTRESLIARLGAPAANSSEFYLSWPGAHARQTISVTLSNWDGYGIPKGNLSHVSVRWR